MARFNRRFFRTYSRFAVLLLLTLLVVAAVFLFHEVLLPFALAVLLAYLLAPVIARLNSISLRRWQIPRGLAILAVYTVILGLLVLSGAYLFPKFYFEVNRMVKTLPSVLHDVEKDFVVPLEQSLNAWFADVFPQPAVVELDEEIGSVGPQRAAGTVMDGENDTPAAELPAWQRLVEDYTYVVRRIDDTRFEVVPQKRRPFAADEERQPLRFNRQLSAAFSQFRQGLEENIIELVVLGRRLIRVLVSSVLVLFLVLMISGFILLDPERIRGFIRSLIPNRYASAFDDWLQRLDRGLSGVIRGQAMICLINGVLTGIGIAILGVPFVVTLSVIAAVFSLIPIFGVLISTIPILLMALTVSLTTALLALGWILIIHFLEGNFLNPKILGDSARIHPVLIVFALLVGEHFAGVLGALLAVPIFSLIQNSFLFLKHKAEGLDSAT